MGKFFMRVFTQLHARLIKATGKLGGGKDDGSLLVLRHTGAKSGAVRETPLAFFTHGDGYVVCGSMAGAPQHPAWVHNLRANPDTVVTIDREAIEVRARELEGDERNEVWARFAAHDKRWEDYTKRTDRVLPLIALEPR